MYLSVRFRRCRQLSRLGLFCSALFCFLLAAACSQLASGKESERKTAVSIVGDAFHISGRPTYEGRTFHGHKIEGLLLNSRMVQGIFDDLNSETVKNWAYPDTGKWDAERNTREFLAAMPSWREHGLLCFTINLQGGSPQGYSQNQPWHNSAITPDGELRPEYMARLKQVIDKADDLGMVVILGVFYFGQDQRLKDEEAVTRALDNAVDWVFDRGYHNVLIEVNNECNVRYDHPILQPDRVHELIERVKARTRDGRRLLVGTSYGGGTIPKENVVRASDFLLLHGNGVSDPQRIAEMVRQTRKVPGYRPMPILFNEDDHFDFDQPENNFTAAIGEYASWGYFDFRMKEEGFDDGYQSVPVNWGISSPRKEAFFAKLKEITGSGQAASVKPRRPCNVVILYADDLGWGDLGCYGHEKFKTPHIDQLAREGARLTNFYSPCPYCAPSRAGLLTGRYPFRCGMIGNPAPDAGINDLGLPPKEITLAEVLKDAGYATACIGKWHLGHKPQFYPTRQGFDSYLGILYSNDMRPVELFQNDKKIEFPIDQRTLTRRYTDAALAFIDQHRDRPFFLYFPHAMPHKPLAASDRFNKQSGAGLYGDVLAELDDSVGQVVARLAEHGLAENTLVIFASDNGPWYGGSSGGLRGMKGQAWEGGIRVPLIARLPGVIPAGHVSHEPAIVMDLFPTILALTGAEPPKDRQLDGKDIGPLLTKGDAKSPHESLVSTNGRVPLSIRVGNWKLHPKGTPAADKRPADWVDPRAPDGTTILAQEEQYSPRDFPGLTSGDESRGPALFDLASDPGEQKNVAEQHPEVVERLSKRFAEWEADARQSLGPLADGPRRKKQP